MKKSKKKSEWSKILVTCVVIFFACYGVWCGVEYYRLVALAIKANATPPDATLAVTCVGTILGAVLSYCLYQGVLKTSLNKNKLTIDKTTGIIRSIAEGDFPEAVQQSVEDCDV